MLIFGHRGARAEAPENTLEGFAHLRSLGIHHVELDLRLCQGELIALHDDTVDRTTPATGHFTEFDLQKFESLKVPTLHSILAAWPELASVQLEVKELPPAEHPPASKRLAELINTFGLSKIATVTSLDHDFIRYSATHYPQIQHGLVFKEDNWTDTPTAIDLAKELNCHILALNYELATPKLVSAAHQAGLMVSCWTVNDVELARKLQIKDVDSVITDIPTRLSKALNPTSNIA